ncbi:MAG: cytochrome c oxidase subunit II [Flavobacteriales bacterium]|jgi:cytochrome c oxidase subunit 2|tara:strand:- start:2725 stop:3948 length:1224 start_codon:yes stop_codon:yes gene_type:complete
MFSLLVLITIVLGVVAAVQLSKVYQLAAKLRNHREEDISLADNKMNAWLMLIWMFVFFAGVIYFYIAYGDYLPVSASAHGNDIDMLFTVNVVIITIVFFLVHLFLFYFSWKYYYREDRKAFFFAHSTKLEMIWTIIPSIVLAFMIIFGLRIWNDITDVVASENPVRLEVYAKQFDWTIRYPGADSELGFSNYNLISGTNPLGIASDELIIEKIAELDEEIISIEKKLNEEGEFLPPSQIDALEDKIYRLQRHKLRINDVSTSREASSGEFKAGKDDKLVKGELHLPLGREVEFIFNSRDVIHSAFMPHFRAQMNAVPGIPTRFKMTPTITTDSMRVMEDNPNFDYILLCNKVCGASHNNMAVKIIIESEEEYQAWLEEQKTFSESLGGDAEETDEAEESKLEPVAEK